MMSQSLGVRYFRLSIILLLSLYGPLVHSDALLIKNASVPEQSLTRSSLLRIYAMQMKVWSDGTPVKVFRLPADDPIHREFVIRYLRLNPYRIDRMWNRLIFSGTGTPPEQVLTNEAMIEAVSSTPGAIGYIDVNMAPMVNASMLLGTQQ